MKLSIWDIENKRKQKTVIVVKSKERGARTKVNACAYSPDGTYIAGGEVDRVDDQLIQLNAMFSLSRWSISCVEDKLELRAPGHDDRRCTYEGIGNRIDCVFG